MDASPCCKFTRKWEQCVTVESPYNSVNFQWLIVDSAVVLCVSWMLQFHYSPGLLFIYPLFPKLPMQLSCKVLKTCIFIITSIIGVNLLKLPEIFYTIIFDRQYLSRTLSSILCTLAIGLFLQNKIGISISQDSYIGTPLIILLRVIILNIQQCGYLVCFLISWKLICTYIPFVIFPLSIMVSST